MRCRLLALTLVLAIACSDEPSGPTASSPLTSGHGLSANSTPTLPINLGTLPGYASSEAEDVNSRGQAVGMAYWPCCRAFIWSGGVITDLGSLRPDGVGVTFAHGINELGQVVGASSSPNSTKAAFVWANGVMQQLPPIVGGVSEAHDINDQGDIVGEDANRATYWPAGGTPTLLPPFPNSTFTSSSAKAINNSRMIVGKAYYTLTWLEERPFVWTPSGGMIDPGLPAGAVAGALEDVNDAGQATGYAIYPTGNGWRAVRWSAVAGWEDLGARTDINYASMGLTIASDGTVGGEAYNGSPGNGCYRTDTSCATLWAPDGTPSALPNLGGQPGLYSDNGQASGISDEGQAVGWAFIPGFPGATLWQYRPSTTLPSVVIAGVLTGNEGDTLHFDGSQSSDPSGGTLTLLWELGDGTRDTGAVVSHFYPDNEDTELGYHVQLVAASSAGTTGAAAVAVFIQNLPPKLTLSPPTQLAVGQAGNFDFTIADPGVLDSPWQVHFDWGDGSPITYLYQTTLGAGSAAHSYSSGGIKRVIVTVFDIDAGIDADTVQVLVIQSARPPVANAGAYYSTAEGMSVTLNASASTDPDGGPLTFAWDFGDGSTGSGMLAPHIYVQDGSYTARVTVTDPTGLSASATAAVPIFNAWPTIVGGPDLSTAIRSPITMQSNLNDLGVLDAPWTMDYDWGDGQTTTLTTSTRGPIQASHSYSEAGSYTARLTVTDKDGGTSADDVVMTVAGELPPIVAVTYANPAYEGADMSFSSVGSNDPNGDALTYLWNFGDGTTSSLAHPLKQYRDNGTFAASLRVTDATGRNTVWTAQVLVNNSAPYATFTKPGSVAEGSSFSLSLTSASDPSPADRAAGFTYAFDCGTGFGAFGAATSKSCPAQPDNGTVQVGGRVRDKDGGIGEYLKPLTVTNVAPKPTISATSPLTFPSGGTFTLNGRFTDPGALDAPWTWSINWGDGTAVTTGASTPGTTFPASHRYTKKGRWTVRMTVRDKNGGSGGSNTVTVTVQ